MVIPSAGDVVLVQFPFSDLSQSKLRPAVGTLKHDTFNQAIKSVVAILQSGLK